MKIKVKILRDGIKLPTFIDKGEWVDLSCAQKTTIIGPMKKNDSNSIAFNNKFIPLGVAMKMPKGFEAWVVPRSSTYKYYGVILTNSKGIIDNSYSGNENEWQFNALAFKKTTIPFGDRICQFRIMPSQRAPFWVKLYWLFVSKIEFVEVDDLGHSDRGGFGSTGRR